MKNYQCNLKLFKNQVNGLICFAMSRSNINARLKLVLRFNKLKKSLFEHQGDSFDQVFVISELNKMGDTIFLGFNLLDNKIEGIRINRQEPFSYTVSNFANLATPGERKVRLL